MDDVALRSAPAAAAMSAECHWCRRESPCECMASVEDGGPWAWRPGSGDFVWTGGGGWSLHPERCMCTCGGCQSE